jgi:hypothetical protein
MQTLPLTQHKIALVDDSDYAALNQWKWTYLPNTRSGYAVRWETRDGKRHTVYMHRQIMGAAKGQLVDHEDGNGLNNQRYNLRLCGRSHNGANKPVPARTIPYRGVYANPAIRRDPFFAQIKFARRIYHLGGFQAQEDAARAYDRAALYCFGSFARLNFPDDVAITLTLPLPRTIARRLEAPQQLALPFDEALPAIELGRMDWIEIKTQVAWRARRIPAPSGIDDDLL